MHAKLNVGGWCTRGAHTHATCRWDRCNCFFPFTAVPTERRAAQIAFPFYNYAMSCNYYIIRQCRPQ